MKIIDKYYKETEHLLYNYRMFEISIKNMQDEIEYLKKEDDVRSVGGIRYDDFKPGPTFKITSSVEDVSLSITETIGYLEHIIKRIKSKLESVDRALEGLTDIERKIVSKRYIQGKQWYVVAYEVSYSERWCKQLRTEAIKKLAIGIFGDAAIE